MKGGAGGVFGASAGDARVVGRGLACGSAAVSSWRCTGGLVVGVGAFAGGCGGDRAGAGAAAGGVRGRGGRCQCASVAISQCCQCGACEGAGGQRTARTPSFVLCLLSSVLSHRGGTPVVQVAPWGHCCRGSGACSGLLRGLTPDQKK